MKFLMVALFMLLGIFGQCQFSESKYIYYDLSDDFGSEILLDSTKKITTFLDDKVSTYNFTKDSLYMQYKNEDGTSVSGQYFITHHVFQTVNRVMNVDTLEPMLSITSYKYPIKTGRWLFYDKDKNLERVEIWENGFDKTPNPNMIFIESEDE